jgi:phage terminase Nu1 subunit (DNA packaging protein)
MQQDEMNMQQDETITQQTLADLLDLTPRRIRQLATAGVIPKTGRGQYQLRDSVRAYCAHQREIAAGRGGEDAQLNLARERSRQAKESADGLALKNEQTRNELISRAEVIQLWGDTLSLVRSRILGAASDIGLELPILSRHDILTIDGVLRSCLESLCDAPAVPVQAATRKRG